MIFVVLLAVCLAVEVACVVSAATPLAVGCLVFVACLFVFVVLREADVL